MPVAIDKLIERIRELEERLEAEFAERRTAFRYHIEKRRVIFEEEVARRHRDFRTKWRAYLRWVNLLFVLTAPFIYGLIIPLVLLDIFVTVYQAICFPVYGIAKVQRGDFLVFDRRHLAYLNWLEKLNCTYCSYASGLIAYVREIASRTERYWCPIKHARRIAGAHGRYPRFAEFGDAEGYQAQLATLKTEAERHQN